MHFMSLTNVILGYLVYLHHGLVLPVSDCSLTVVNRYLQKSFPLCGSVLHTPSMLDC